MKNQVDTVDATPSKRLYLSIIADYGINQAIAELIDNAIDIWVKNGKRATLSVDVDFDQHQQRISVCDNAGGVNESELSLMVGPGHTGNTDTDHSIGIFGVGTKRAVVALAQNVSIKTRQDHKTYQIEFDDSWISDNDEWNLPVYQVDEISPRTTQIELLKLRKSIREETIVELRDFLGCCYSKYLTDNRIKLILNGDAVAPVSFESWAFPPGFEPRRYVGSIQTSDGSKVEVQAMAGLSSESSPAGGEYGVYFYCNERLIARALKSIDVGFARGLAGKPHADIALSRVLVSLTGEARLMPWNSSKSDVNTSHEVFGALQVWLVQVVKDFSSLSRRLSKQEGGWQQNVFRYKTGNIKEIIVDDFPAATTSYLPPLPEMRPRYPTRIANINKDVSSSKPWTTGLYESVIATDWVLSQNLSQKNRLALILLDSTLEIGFKEYLVNDSGKRYSETKLAGLMKNRIQVHEEVEELTDISSEDWGKISHYYDLRCQLIHRRASVTLSDSDINDFRSVVERVLGKLFDLKF